MLRSAMLNLTCYEVHRSMKDNGCPHRLLVRQYDSLNLKIARLLKYPEAQDMRVAICSIQVKPYIPLHLVSCFCDNARNHRTTP